MTAAIYTCWLHRRVFTGWIWCLSLSQMSCEGQWFVIIHHERCIVSSSSRKNFTPRSTELLPYQIHLPYINLMKNTFLCKTEQIRMFMEDQALGEHVSVSTWTEDLLGCPPVDHHYDHDYFSSCLKPDWGERSEERGILKGVYGKIAEACKV